MDEADEVYLYDPALLSGVDLTKSRCNFNPAVLSAIDPAPGIRLRPLSSKDYDRGKLSGHCSEVFSFVLSVIFSFLQTDYFNDSSRISGNPGTADNSGRHF